MKKGQLSLYIVIGIVILLLVALIFHLEKNKELDISPVEHADAYEYMRLCMEQNAEEILREAGRTGGRFTEEVMFTSYAKHGGTVLLPGLDEIGKTVSGMLELAAGGCINNSPLKGKTVEPKKPRAEVGFYKDSTGIMLKDAYTVRQGGSVSSSQDIQFTLDIRFAQMHGLADYIAHQGEYLMDAPPAEEKPLTVTAVEQDGYTLYIITDREDGKSYNFIFAIG